MAVELTPFTTTSLALHRMCVFGILQCQCELGSTAIYRYMRTVTPPIHPKRWKQALAAPLAPLITLWICATVTISYGYHGSCRMELGPSSSRLLKASSVFVKQIEVLDDYRKGVLLYGFSKKPEPSVDLNWSTSSRIIVRSRSRKGFSLWLNKGSRIRLRWKAHGSSLSSHQLVSLIKGERKVETMLSASKDGNGNPFKVRDMEYTVEEDDRYHVDITNANSRNIVIEMNVNVTSKIYDTTKAKSMCSAVNGSCRLGLIFPDTQYVILSTPNDGKLDGWYIELSFATRMITYVAILGVVVIVTFLILKYLGACDDERNVARRSIQEITETRPLVQEKGFRYTYGTGDDQSHGLGTSGDSLDALYDEKICVICYDEPRNCFFVPCGHCATCYGCAQRVSREDSKACPICRRTIHKVRKLPRT